MESRQLTVIQFRCANFQSRFMNDIVTVRPIPVVAILICILLLTVRIAYGDLTGTGLKDGMYYRSLGVIVYAVFYGGAIVGLWMFGNMLFYKSRYLQHDETNLYVKGRNIGRLRDIQNIEKSSKFFVIGNLSFRISGKIISLSSLLVQQHLQHIEAELHRLQQREN